MPNPLRLVVLIQLREAVGLSQSDMADRCGLRGRQSRKSVAAWELGQTIPRRRHRQPIALYLLRDLKLYRDLPRFAGVWQILVEEWEWEPLTDGERATLLAQALPPTSMPPTTQPIEDDIAQAVAPALPVTPLPQQPRSGGTVKRLGWFYTLPRLWIVGLALLLLTASGYGVVAIRGQTAPLIYIEDGSFEAEDGLKSWGGAPFPCPFQVVENAVDAVDGTRYLSVRRRDGCAMFGQTRPIQADTTQTYTFLLWTRATLAQSLPLTLQLEARGETTFAEALSIMVGPVWQCYSLDIVLPNGNFQTIAAQIRLQGPENQGTYEFDALSLNSGSDATCPPPALALFNPGFEEADSPLGWDALADCGLEIGRKAGVAHSGQRYLIADRSVPGCYSLYQDLAVKPVPGQSVQGSVWVRSEDGSPLNLGLSIWALGGAEQEEIRHNLTVEGEGWRCVETVLLVNKDDHTGLRFEVYLDSYSETRYLLDDTQIRYQADVACPEADLALHSTEIDPQNAFYPGSTVSVWSEVRNAGIDPLVAGSHVDHWIAAAPDGPPIDPVLNYVITLPRLEPGMHTQSIPAYVQIPLNLEAYRPYYVVWDVRPPVGYSDVAQANNRQSRPLEIVPCERDTPFCDLPVGMWGYDEIVRWHELEITTGCRSGTIPFKNRPFCPNQFVTRSALPVFLLRHHYSAEYQPEGPYQGKFVDLPQDFSHRRAYWVEAFYDLGMTMESETCPPSEEGLRFCPHQFVTRAELMAYLAQFLGWELTPVQGNLFVDVTLDTPANRAIEYAARNGFFADDDPHCPPLLTGDRFCPDDPARRAFVAVVLVRAFGEN